MITSFTCKCGANNPSDGKFYDGSLGYEAIVCRKCGTYSDHEGEHEADKWSKEFVGLIEPFKPELVASGSNTSEEHEWEDFEYEIKQLYNKMRTKYFFVYGADLTWNHASGYKMFKAIVPMALIHNISVRSDWRMEIYTTEERNKYRVTIFHHDKPTGANMFLMSQNKAKKDKTFKKYFEKDLVN